MDFTTLEITINQRVAIVRLAREAVRNAFNEVSIAELTQVFGELGDDDGAALADVVRQSNDSSLPARRHKLFQPLKQRSVCCRVHMSA